ncbi:MAG: winged helix-turn-helix transcriptional regulator [Peptoniphilus sp. oral taxon 375]|nr:sugar-specific transcriptional regulator, TrmB family [Peptoniphilus sp. oral taxon 375 str. F0436]MBS4872668.1 winged helix-turn-helix transcriptional regulator [Peptoniphilus sp. oral taxon 375]
MQAKYLSQEDKEKIQEKYRAFEESTDLMDLLSSIFKVLGDPTRLKIIYLLSQSPLCVNDIVELIGMSQSSISHQLSLLKRKKLIKSEKDGRRNIYSLDDDHVLSLFYEGYNHASHRLDEKND